MRFGCVGQQIQDRKSDEEVIRGAVVSQPEGCPQGVTLRARQALEPVEHGRAQLVQSRERQLHLRLHARRPRNAAPRRLPGDVVEQRRLAHAGFAAQDEHTTLARPHSRHQAIEQLALAAPAAQLRAGIAARHIHRRSVRSRHNPPRLLSRRADLSGPTAATQAKGKT
jgi:hypothetical protein